MKNVFVYGSLKKGYWNHRCMEMAGGKLIDNGKLKGACLYAYASFPALAFNKNQNKIVRGELYKVKDMSPLDSLEGYPSFYNRSQVEVELDNGKKETAWVYHFNQPPQCEVIESGIWPK